MTAVQAIPLIKERLTELLNAPVDAKMQRPVGRARPDLVATSGGTTFVVVFRAQGNAMLVGSAVEQALSYARGFDEPAVPMVAVPYMDEVGSALCSAAGASWLDLSGNASITAPNLRILVKGEANRFKRPGRPINLFSPKRARIIRQLLLDPGQHHSQAELASLTGLGSGYVSMTTRELVEAGLAAHDELRRIFPPDPDRLLEAWAAGYRFDRHQRLAGHVASRTGHELLAQVVAPMTAAGEPFAATGLAAAWQMAPMAHYRLVALYVRQFPSRALLEELGFREEQRGANLWFLLPDDEGVYAGGGEWQGVPCVSPVQTWLDLQDMWERSQEAADELRRLCLNWSPADGG